MNALYFDCFAGISGDMIIGALIDLGLDPADLERELSKLSLSGYRLQVSRVDKHGIQASTFRVFLKEDSKVAIADSEFEETNHLTLSPSVLPKRQLYPERSLKEILKLIEQSDLSDGIKSISNQIFLRLGQAEAKVHELQLEDVHFHEVGGVDAILDIVGAAIGFEKLGIEAVFASPLHLGTGFVRSDHGILPVPAPATAELLTGVPVFTSDVKGELVTPTGAAILTAIANGYGPMPEMTVRKIGYGAGTRDRAFPNVLRAFMGDLTKEAMRPKGRVSRAPHPEQHESSPQAGGFHEGPGIILEANIDDSNPQLFEYLSERLLDAGALDVTLIPVYMKKNRPGVLLQVLVLPEGVEALLQIIFRESTTIGVRSYPVTKHMLQREVILVPTIYGELRVKLSRLGEEVVNVTPEYEDCRELAIRCGVAIKEVHRQALVAFSAMDSP
jgi:uncharacterized protein (TIGR00299 family) protein